MSSDVDDFLNQGNYEAHEAFEFSEVGAAISGTILTTPRIVEVKDNFSETGKSKKLVIDLETADGSRSIWVKSGHGLQRAIGEASKDVGLAQGGKLKVRRIEDGEPKQAGYNAPHQFEAKYEPPVSTVDVSSDDWGD